jgi:Ca2+-binding EF-hand superfamily protein
MGNTTSAPQGSKPLAISAIARQLSVNKAQLKVLRDEFQSLADKKLCITHHLFRLALKKAKIDQKDKEIFNLLFTMWDNQGEGTIPYKEFVVGMSPLACPDEHPKSIIQFALEVSDDKKSEMIGADELEDLLQSKLDELNVC